MAARLTLAVVALLLLFASPFRWAAGDYSTAISNQVFGWWAIWLIGKSKGAR